MTPFFISCWAMSLVRRRAVLAWVCALLSVTSCKLPARDIQQPDQTPPGVALFLMEGGEIVAAAPLIEPFPNHAIIDLSLEHKLLAVGIDADAGVAKVQIDGETETYCRNEEFAQNSTAIFAREPEVSVIAQGGVPTLRSVELELEAHKLSSFCQPGFRFDGGEGFFSASAVSYGGAAAQTPFIVVTIPQP